MMPATRAVCSGSPFLTVRARMARRAAAFMRTSQPATASRAVSTFGPTSTIRTWPVASTCERTAPGRLRLLDGIGVIFLDTGQEKREAFHRHRQIDVLQLHL